MRVTDQEKLKGYIKKWKDHNILVGAALYIEVLKPAACLSLTLQQRDADIIFSIKGVLTFEHYQVSAIA